MEKYLIVCPQDSTTTFLHGIFTHLSNKTVITGEITKYKLQEYIENHSRVIMCGHGSPNGLLSVGKFPESPYIIDDTMVSALRNKANTIYIWFNADQFVRRHGLAGFHTGMFLSQMSECVCFGVECTEVDITESNNGFANMVFRYIDEPPIVFYKNVLVDYGRLAQKNPVARYNHYRLYLNQFTPDLFLPQVVQKC